MRMVCLCRKSTILSRQDDDDDDCRDGDLSMTIVMMKDEMTMMLIEEVQIMSSILSRHNFFLGLFLIQTKIFTKTFTSI